MPRSRVPYATDQITVYRYCPYECAYCYVWRLPFFARRVRAGRYDPVEEAEKYLSRRGRTIVVSSVSDPYPREEVRLGRTRRVLEVLARNPANRVMVLTKNPRLALRDADILSRHPGSWLGATIVVADERYRLVEPLAPHPGQRLAALKLAREWGLRTWVSVEPVLPGLTTAELLERVAEVADFVVLGPLNYPGHLRESLAYTVVWGELKREHLEEYYREFIPRAVEILEAGGVEYYVKPELEKYLDR